jgi:hypothetical protein
MAYDKDAFARLMAVDKSNSKREFEDQASLFSRIGSALPAELEEQRQSMLDAVTN